jgi:hypothetical protein
MLAVFCLRLAAGMLACLLVLPARLINPRFFRTHYLVALGLTCVAWLTENAPPWLSLPLHLTLGASLLLAFAGSFVWALEGSPGARVVAVLSVLILAAALALTEIAAENVELSSASIAPLLIGAFTSAAVLGTSLTAMLMGHSYLVAPSMSLVPLLRLIALFAAAIVVRMAVECYRIWWWTRHHSWDNLGNEPLLALAVRWGIGFLVPLILAGMAWQTTRIRSTQSSTGILYVVVVFVFLGELTGLVLREKGITL